MSCPNTECWPWTGYITANGYGRLGQRYAHRAIYEWMVGPIPDGLQIDHLCRNRSCVNPEHLEAVTQRENLLRGVGSTAIHAKATHCQRGHAKTPENTYVRPDNGKHSCVPCYRLRTRAWRAAHALS